MVTRKFIGRCHRFPISRQRVIHIPHKEHHQDLPHTPFSLSYLRVADIPQVHILPLVPFEFREIRRSPQRHQASQHEPLQPLSLEPQQSLQLDRNLPVFPTRSCRSIAFSSFSAFSRFASAALSPVPAGVPAEFHPNGLEAAAPKPKSCVFWLATWRTAGRTRSRRSASVLPVYSMLLYLQTWDVSRWRTVSSRIPSSDLKSSAFCERASI